MFLTVAPVHVPAGLLPPDRPGHRPRPRRGLRAVDPGDLRRRLAGRPAGAPTPTSTSTPSSTRRPAGPAARRSRPRPSPGDGTVTRGVADALAGDPAPPADLAGRGRGPRRVRGGRPARGAHREPRRRRARARRDRPRRGRRAAGGRGLDRRPARARDAATGRRCRSSAALASIPAYWLIARRVSAALGSRRSGSAGSGSRWPGGRTSSGSTRAISAARQLHPLGHGRVDRERRRARAG